MEETKDTRRTRSSPNPENGSDYFLRKDGRRTLSGNLVGRKNIRQKKTKNVALELANGWFLYYCSVVFGKNVRYIPTKTVSEK